jgi:hypothetical protein
MIGFINVGMVPSKALQYCPKLKDTRAFNYDVGDGPHRTLSNLGKCLRQLGESKLPQTAAHWVTALDVHHLNATFIPFLLRLLQSRASIRKHAI